ncbi:hypothetical protein ACE193_10730 [Bernardetia sp. OM2101]|uniref:hypothetical protein n=1 Tax=Bernardetia sp. OM2101 TaxID=3344876 RepID=UPI0035CF8CBA
MYRNLLLDNKYEIVSGKINNHNRQNWRLDRIAKESFEIEGIYFNYKKQTPFFFPSYHATLSDEVITNDKLMRIKYITEDSTNYILSIEELTK